jgi:membrane protease YdiL (CAAX protease family)
MLVHAITFAFALILLVVVPVLSLLTARQPQLRLIPRIDLYASAAASQWVLTILAVGLALLDGSGLASFGLRPLAREQFAVWTAALTGGTLAGLTLMSILESRGLWPSDSDLVEILIPRTGREKFIAVVLVAPTAAICEEIIYRGFLFPRLLDWTDSATWALVIASVGFGLAHAYQGFHGMVRAAVLGALLTVPLVRTGSLYPSMVSHFLIDAVALIWLGPKFLKPPTSSPS